MGCRIDSKTKHDASEVIEAMGLSVSDAIRIFLKRVATEGTIPFDLRLTNAKTIAAMVEIENPQINNWNPLVCNAGSYCSK